MTEFLAVTDLHYCMRNVQGDERQNYLSKQKLENIIKRCPPECDFVINLGDTADSQPGFGDQRFLAREIYSALEKSGKPVYCAIGNHDTSLRKEELAEILRMPSRYYDFETEDFHCIVLDANMNSPEKPLPESEIEWSETYLDPSQLEFLKSSIDKADKPVLVFCHELFMLGAYGEDNPHVIRNRDEAVSIFEESGKVKAVFCGHYHYGDHVKHGGVHYFTFNALVNYDEESYAVVKAGGGKIIIEGHGLQRSAELDYEI